MEWRYEFSKEHFVHECQSFFKLIAQLYHRALLYIYREEDFIIINFSFTLKQEVTAPYNYSCQVLKNSTVVKK